MTNENTSQGQERRAARAPGVATPWSVHPAANGAVCDALGRMVATFVRVGAAEVAVAAVNTHAEREAKLASLRADRDNWRSTAGDAMAATAALREELRVARETASALQAKLDWTVEDMARDLHDAEQALARLAARIDDAEAGEPARIGAGSDAGCIECTSGTVPDALNTGLCPYHVAVALVAPERLDYKPRLAQGSGEPRRDDDPVHDAFDQPPLGWHFDSEGVKRCDECGDEGHAGQDCPSVPDDYSADVHDASEHAPAGGGVGLP